MDLKIIRRFLKGVKTAGLTLNEVYQRFLWTKPPSGDREEFEKALLSVGTHVAKRTLKSCRTYPPDQYWKYIKEQGFVSPGLWAEAHGGQRPPSVPEPVVVPEPKPLATTSIPPADMEERCYENLLPADWLTLTLPQKIDFTKKVLHKGFKQYILRDKKLAAYFSQLKEKDPGPALYVTVFSFPSANYSEEAKGLLRVFVGVLNDVGRARLRYVECNEPPMPPTVEIREIRGV